MRTFISVKGLYASLVLLTLLFFVLSCNKEEDDEMDFSSDLIGEWIFTHDEGYVCKF